jgi:hypothetical protein
MLSVLGPNMQTSFGRIATALGVFVGIGIAQVAFAQAVCSADAADRVENAPFSAQRRVMTITRKADGTSSRDEATESEARDGKGRTYSASERYWTTVVGNERVQKSELLVTIDDPVANTTTKWSSGSKEVKLIHWPQPTGDNRAVKPPFNPFADAQNSDVQKLGTKTIEGVLVEGFRMSYAPPRGHVKCDEENVHVEECWYSSELKVVILETDNVPCERSFTNQLENIVRGEPDVEKYQPPASYVRQNVEISAPTP